MPVNDNVPQDSAPPRFLDLTDRTSTVPIIVTTSLVGSSSLIEMYESGTLISVGAAVVQHQKLGQELANVEARLRACNEPLALVEFQQYCDRRHRNFAKELHNLVARLEMKKNKLLSKLQEIEARIGGKEPSLAGWLKNHTYSPPRLPVTLVPEAVTRNPAKAARDRVIAENRTRKTREICRILDDKIEEGKLELDCLPASWAKRYGVRTFEDAFRNPGCKRLVFRLVSGAKGKRYYANTEE